MAAEGDIPNWLAAGGGLAALVGLVVGPFRLLAKRILAIEMGREILVNDMRREREQGDRELWKEIKELRQESAKFRAEIATRGEMQIMLRELEARIVPLMRRKHDTLSP